MIASVLKHFDNFMQILPRNHVRAELLRRNHTVLGWAQERGYNHVTTQSAIDRWAGRRGKPRVGSLTESILHDLEDTIGAKIYIRRAKPKSKPTA